MGLEVERETSASTQSSLASPSSSQGWRRSTPHWQGNATSSEAKVKSIVDSPPFHLCGVTPGTVSRWRWKSSMMVSRDCAADIPLLACW